MKEKNLPRRNFLKTTGAAFLGSSIIPMSTLSASNIKTEELTIQEVIDLIKSKIPGELSEYTVDTVKIGDPSQPIKGVVSTFLATAEVIDQAAWLGANLIITHEPTFYNHRDDTAWLEKDKVYKYKKALLEKHNIVVWRFHDFWHQHRPDGILTGFLKQAGWQSYLDKTRENICVVPPISLRNLASYFKKQFQLTRTFFIGNPELKCKTVGLLPGAWGGTNHMNFFMSEDIDVLIVGEAAEWETVEYIRDAAYAGMKKGLIILGHARSEEPGMRWLVDWLQPMIPTVPVAYVAAGDPFVSV